MSPRAFVPIVLLLAAPVGAQQQSESYKFLQAIKEAGKQDQIKVYGFCAADTPLEGEYVACAAQEPYEYARIVLENVQTYLGGEDVPAEVLQPLKLYTSGQEVGAKEFG